MVSDIDAKIKRSQTKLDAPIPENERSKEVQEKLEKYDTVRREITYWVCSFEERIGKIEN